MNRASHVVGMLALLGGPALAADPTGNWLVADKTAIIRVAPCGAAYCGTIAWTAEPGLDEHNPDPSKRNHPIVGTQILLDMKPGRADRWEGKIYNPDNGKTYSGHITVVAPNQLKVEGCLLFFCSGETWTRASKVPP
jgi:uncharacterized protein (DUF2147 family)